MITPNKTQAVSIPSPAQQGEPFRNEQALDPVTRSTIPT